METPSCRICWDDATDDEVLVAPCSCRGTHRVAHLTCILDYVKARERWLDVCCPTCQKPYCGQVGVAVAKLSLQALERQMGFGCITPEIAIANRNLAWAYASICKYDAAMPHAKTTLATQLISLGPQHVEVAYTLDLLAKLWQCLGKPMHCKFLQEKALIIKRQVLGPEHPSMADTIANLGMTHIQFGNLAKGLDLLESSLAVMEQNLGPMHLDTANILTHLGGAYLRVGKMTHGRDLLERALAIQERELGPEHLLITNTLTYLGSAVSLLGELARGKELIDRALSIAQREDMLPNQSVPNAGLAALGNSLRLEKAALIRDLLAKQLAIKE